MTRRTRLVWERKPLESWAEFSARINVQQRKVQSEVFGIVTPSFLRKFVETSMSDAVIEVFIMRELLKWQGEEWTDDDTHSLVQLVCRAIYVSDEGGERLIPERHITAEMVQLKLKEKE